MVIKQPVIMLYNNLNFRQAISQDMAIKWIMMLTFQLNLWIRSR